MRAVECNCNGININRGWNKCGYISSDFKINVDTCRYKDLVRECFGKINLEGINLKHICLKGIDTDGYALYQNKNGSSN